MASYMPSFFTHKCNGMITFPAQSVPEAKRKKKNSEYIFRKHSTRPKVFHIIDALQTLKATSPFRTVHFCLHGLEHHPSSTTTDVCRQKNIYRDNSFFLCSTHTIPFIVLLAIRHTGPPFHLISLYDS